MIDTCGVRQYYQREGEFQSIDLYHCQNKESQTTLQSCQIAWFKPLTLFTLMNLFMEDKNKTNKNLNYIEHSPTYLCFCSNNTRFIYIYLSILWIIFFVHDWEKPKLNKINLTCWRLGCCLGSCSPSCAHRLFTAWSKAIFVLCPHFCVHTVVLAFICRGVLAFKECVFYSFNF